jgi:WD40 repeat protein
MAKNRIGGSLSPDTLEFDPEQDPIRYPVQFQVSVVNLGEVFASFRVELFASGADPNLDHNWYKPNPTVSVKKPPGDSTTFIVSILAIPIPGVRMINVTVVVSSLDFPDVLRHSLRLLVKPKPGIQLQMELPKDEFAAKPREMVPIPVRLLNRGQQPADLILRFTGLDSGWLNGGDQLRVVLKPGQGSEVAFQCQPPVAAKAPSQSYPFSIGAFFSGSEISRVNGILRVLPVGMVTFACQPEEHWMPPKFWWFPIWKSIPVTYELSFKNASNVPQTLEVKVEGDRKKCKTLQLTPEQTPLQTGSSQIVAVEVFKSRPWIGGTQKVSLEAIPHLSDPRIEQTDPVKQTLLLYLRPVLPLWLQLLLLLLAILAALLAIPYERHTSDVNAVRFSGVVEPILSGSEDHTVRAWQDATNTPLCRWTTLQRFCLKARGVLVSEEKTGGRSVTALRYQPLNNELIAIGLDNGVIQLWDVNKGNQIGQDFEEARDDRNDRVLDLIFSRDSRYLLTAHGSGHIRQWDLSTPDSKQLKKIRVGPALYTLSFSKDPAETTLVAAGRENGIVLWKWKTEATPKPMIYPIGSKNDYIFSSVTIEPNWLITADTQAFITIWDLSQCQGSSQQPGAVECEQLDRWQLTNTNKKPIPLRSIDVVRTEQGDYYLASGGDDTTIRLWRLGSQGRRDPEFVADRDRGLVLANYFNFARFQDINSIKGINLIIQGQRLLVVSGDSEYNVRLATYSLGGESP